MCRMKRVSFLSHTLIYYDKQDSLAHCYLFSSTYKQTHPCLSILSQSVQPLPLSFLFNVYILFSLFAVNLVSFCVLDMLMIIENDIYSAFVYVQRYPRGESWLLSMSNAGIPRSRKCVIEKYPFLTGVS